MSNGPWPTPKDRAGATFVTVKGVRYRVEGTGHSYGDLTRQVRNGLAVIVSEGDERKGEK